MKNKNREFTAISIKGRIAPVLFVCGTLCLLDFGLMFATGTTLHAGTAALVFIGAFFIFFGFRWSAGKPPLLKSRILSRGLAFCLVLLLLSFAAVETLIWTSAGDESGRETDYVILLGAGLQGDRISATFQNRLDRCAEYLVKYPDAKVVVSGGQGIGETITEAEAMKAYLVSAGIPEDRILKEERATSTYENLAYSKAILDGIGGAQDYTALIVTNDFHLYRAKILSSRLGLAAYGMPARTWWGAYPGNSIREYLAVVKSWLFDRP